MKYPRDRYDKEFSRINASWGFEDNALSEEEKEQVYNNLINNKVAPQFKTAAGGKAMNEYCYPGTNVLINHFDIKNEELLQKAERYHTAYRAMEMRFNLQKKTFDYDHLKAIHKHLFQDVYPFAGQVRTTNIGKKGYWFCDTNMISRLGDQIFSELKVDRFLKGLSKDDFSNKAAYYYTEINFMHPFREGNGRAIREFFGELSKAAGYELNWQEVPKDEYFHAVKMTDDPKQRTELVNVFKKCLKPIKESENLLIRWNEPTESMKLKDVLKIPEGLPSSKANVDAGTLNKFVDRFQINKNGTSIKVQFKGEQDINTIPLEKHQHLSVNKRNQMLDQAAATTSKISQLNKFLEPG